MTTGIRKLFATTSIAMILATVLATPAHAQNYRFYDQDRFDFTTADRSVRAAGALNWFTGDLHFRPDTVRGQLANTSWVQLQRAGCLHVRLTWNVIGGDVSWPPSVRGEGVTNGYYPYCGQAGAWINITGMAHTTVRMAGATLAIGYSNNRNLPRRYDAYWKMKVTGQ